MKRLLALACLVSISTLPSFAGSRRRTVVAPDPTAPTMVVLSGKVVLGDGSAFTASADIQTMCNGQKRTETHSDANGNFSFQFGGVAAATEETSADVDSPYTGSVGGRPERRDLQGCDLQASLTGFTSDVIRLNERFSGSENADVGRIVLHRIKDVEGLTISATTAQAPEPARKALEKAQEKEKKGQWEEAQKLLERAVNIFPKFAVAWFELGNVQLEKGQVVAARESFRHSIEADGKYVNPYRGLMRLALRDRNWPELTNISQTLLSLNPINFPEAWYANGLAHYFLQHMTEAENSARRGLAVDAAHQVPKLEYLLGTVLMEKASYPEATGHLQSFLSLVTKPSEIAEAQRQLAEAVRLSATRQIAAEKK